MLRLYRLVNKDHDDVDRGGRLRRPSNKSEQKLGHGMYFALTREDAEKFIAAEHGHSYTHLVEVEVPYRLEEFGDLRKIEVASALAHPPFSDIQRINDRYVEFCAARGEVGVIWESRRRGWTELVILVDHIRDGFVITRSSPLSKAGDDEGND
jgi:hypothetical protein